MVKALTSASCGETVDAPCYVEAVPASLDPLWIFLGVLLLMVALIAAAQVRRP